MKRFFQAVPIFCTLLLVGVGAFMPRLASLAQDQQLENHVSLLNNQSISLALEQETDFLQTLKLFGSVTSQVELSVGNRMKSADAEAAAVEALMSFAAPDVTYGSLEVTPMLLTSKSIPGLSGIFWRCVWSDTTIKQPEESIRLDNVLWLDDQSGKMVSFSGVADWSGLSTPPQLAVDVAEYCRQSYPVDTVKLALTDEDDLGLFSITVTKSQNGRDVSLVIPMRFLDGWLFFNEMPF